jgi:hypothetical protein
MSGEWESVPVAGGTATDARAWVLVAVGVLALAELDQAWGDEYDPGVSDTGWWTRRTESEEPEIIRATATGLDAALRAGRML